MMQGAQRRLWLRALLFALAAIIMAVTFIAYFSPEALVSFSTLQLC